jgi:hypothetical protein
MLQAASEASLLLLLRAEEEALALALDAACSPKVIT